MAWLYRVCCALSVRGVASLLGLLIVVAPLAACTINFGNIGPNVLQPTNLQLGIPDAAIKAPVTGPLPDDTTLHVRITFKVDQNAMKQAEQQKIQPGQQSHLEEFAKKVGIDDATYQKIKDFFSTKGIALKLSKLRTHLAIDARAGTVAKLMETKFVLHKNGDRTYYTPDAAKPPKVPLFLANSIDAITGLDDYSPAPAHSSAGNLQTHAQLKKSAQPDCSPLDQTLLPRQVAHAYGFDQLWNRGWNGQNMTINLVEVDGSYKADVQNYLDCINFKGHVQTINVDGHPRDALGESTLDIQMVAGLARSANIKVYQTDASSSNSDIWVNVNDMLQQISDDNVNNANAGNTVSISLGAAEGDISQQDIRAIDRSIQQLTQVNHMTVFVASGDCGAFTSGVYGKLDVSFPASDPWAVAVGGTILQIDGQNNRANEVVWSDGSDRSKCKNRWGSGGGISVVFPHSPWQNAAGVPQRPQRQLPDVSAVAYALAVYFKGQWGAVGGTSAAAPIWAAGLALVNQGLLQQVHTFKPSPSLFYSIANNSGGAQPYYNVTRGNNLYYNAGPGWSYTSGLGTPNLVDFYQAARNNM
ncbi:MAG: S53 family serine peptidase [Ktedonobacteraceae bacterium]